MKSTFYILKLYTGTTKNMIKGILLVSFDNTVVVWPSVADVILILNYRLLRF